MNIQYYGDFCFKITTKPGGRATEDVVIWTDPPEKSTGIRSPFGHADIVLLSRLDPSDEAVSGLKDDPVLLHTPGEYSVKGVRILGFPSFRDAESGAVRGRNVVYAFDSEDIRVVFLGAIGHGPDKDMLEKIGDVDILIVPVGGMDTVPARDVDELIRSIEPNIVIPMHYDMPDTTIGTGSSEEFCRETGCKIGEEVSKLSLKKKDLEGKSMEVIFLQKS